MFDALARQSKPKARGYSAERCINVFARNTDGIARLPLMGRGGFKALADVGGPVRVVIGMGGYVYIVAGGALRRWRAGTMDLIGAIPDDENTTMAASGSQLAIVAGGAYYICTGTTLTQYTSGAVDVPVGVAYQDGFFVVIGTGGGRSDAIATSNLDDGTTFDSLNFAFEESSADALKGVISDHGELWMFGQDSLGTWYNTGSSGFPFAPNVAGRIERGVSSAATIAKADNGVFWLGDDGIVYRSGGGTPEVISTREIEEEIADGGVFAGFTFSDRGHKFYALARRDKTTLCFDLTTRLWAERSTGVHDDPWICTTAARVEGQEYFGTSTGYVGILDADQRTDDGERIEAEVVSVPIDARGEYFTISKVHVDVSTGETDLGQVQSGLVDLETEAGEVLTTEAGVALEVEAFEALKPQIMLQVSKDGHTWGNERWRQLGALGQYDARAAWHGLGTGRRFQLRIRITDPVQKDIHGVSYA